jgi:hypothetical protein
MSGRRVIEKMVDRLIDEGVTLAPCDWGIAFMRRPFQLAVVILLAQIQWNVLRMYVENVPISS